MRVNNINGTADNACACGSWLAHWKNFSGRPAPPTCSVTTCYNRPAVGAHVQKEDAADAAWYIVPLCEVHNASATPLDIGTTPLVPANQAATCAKALATP